MIRRILPKILKANAKTRAVLTCAKAEINPILNYYFITFFQIKVEAGFAQQQV